MTTTTHPSVPVPAGTTADDWQRGDPMPYRFVFGANRGITDHTVCISTASVQWADDSIDDGQIEAPSASFLNGDTEVISGLNSDQLRELAALILEAADELDRWVAR